MRGEDEMEVVAWFHAVEVYVGGAQGAAQSEVALGGVIKQVEEAVAPEDIALLEDSWTVCNFGEEVVEDEGGGEG